MANMQQRLMKADAFGNTEKLMQCFELEQFYRTHTEKLNYWVQPQLGVTTVAEAADLAEKFVSRRVLQEINGAEKSNT